MGFLPRYTKVCPNNVKISAFVELSEAIVLADLDFEKSRGILAFQGSTFYTFSPEICTSAFRNFSFGAIIFHEFLNLKSSK